MMMIAYGEEEQEAKREGENHYEENTNILEEKTPAEWKNLIFQRLEIPF